MATEVAAAHVVLDAKIAGLTSGLAAADAQVRGFAGRADATAAKTGVAWRRMGVLMAKGALIGAGAAAAGFVSAVKTASDFETRLSHLQAVSEASASEMDAMRESALDLGASTKFSAREVAEAQVELAKAGMDVSEVLGGSLKASLALAAAGEIELAQASETVVNTMGQFGLGAGEAIHIADALAEAANATTTDVDELAQALENAGPMAANAGMSLDQTIVALEMLAKSGTKGAEAGTTWRSMLTQLARPTEKSAKLMRELGVEFFDAQGNFKDIADVSTMLRKSFAGLNAEQRSNAASTIAGTYGQKALLAVLRGGPGLANQYAKGLQKQGVAAKVAETMNDNLAGKLEQLGGAIETIQIRIGSALIPIISDAAVATAEWLDALGDSEGMAAFAEGAADALKDFGTAAMVAWGEIQPLLVQLGGIAATAFSGLQSTASAAAPVLQTTAGLIGDVASAALTVAGPLMTFQHTIMGIPGVAQAATAGLVGLGAAFLTMRAATAGAGIASSIGAFAQLAGTVRSASDAAALAGATFPRMAGLVAAIASPAGTAALAVGGLVGTVALLASSGGPNAAERLASALRAVEEAANGARGSVSQFTDAVGVMRDADVELTSAKADLLAAEERLRQVRSDANASAGQRAQAEAAVEQATRRVVKAHQANAQAQRDVRTQAVDGVVALARLATAGGRAATEVANQKTTHDALAQSMNLTGERARSLAADEAKLANQNATTSERMAALRNNIRRVSEQMDDNTKAGRETKAVLDDVLNLNDAGLVRFAGRLQEIERTGVPSAQALNQALDEVARDRDVRITARDRASEIARAVKRNVDSISDKTVLISAIDAASAVARSVQSAIASIPATKITTLITQPVHRTGSPTVYQTIDMINDLPSRVTKTVTFTPHGTGAMEQATRRAQAAVSPGNLKGLRARYGGGSLNPLQEAISGAGGLLIRADLQVDNLPEVLAEAREVGLTVGGDFGKAIDAQRKALARTVGQSNELIRRIEQLRSLTGQLGQAQANIRRAQSSKDKTGLKQAQAEAARITRQIAQAQAAFRKLAGGRGAADALARFDRTISAQIRNLGTRAGELRDRAEDMRAAKERAFEALSTSALAAFDEQTARQMERIASKFEDGYRLIGGVFELVPGEFRKAEERVKAEAGRMQSTLDAELGRIEAVFKQRGKALDGALSVETDALEAAYDAQIRAVENRNRELTAAERELAGLREGKAAEDRARATQEAEEALREAVAKRMPEAEVQQRMRAVQEARLAERIAGLEKQAEVERAAADAQAEAEKAAWEKQREVARGAMDDRHEALREGLRSEEEIERKAAQDRYDAAVEALNRRAEAERLYWQRQLQDEQASLQALRDAERASLEAGLDQWRRGLGSIRSVVGGNHASVLAQVERFSTELERSGKRLGADYAQGLRDSFPELRSAASAAADIIARYLRLNSPADAGALASLDHWWEPFGDTLLAGADMRAAEALMSHYADPMRGGAIPPAGGGGQTVVNLNVTVEDRTFAGMSRDQARRVAQQIGPELDRRVSARIPAA